MLPSEKRVEESSAPILGWVGVAHAPVREQRQHADGGTHEVRTEAWAKPTVAQAAYQGALVRRRSHYLRATFTFAEHVELLLALSVTL